jgi:hypothetical protein
LILATFSLLQDLNLSFLDKIGSSTKLTAVALGQLPFIGRIVKVSILLNNFCFDKSYDKEANIGPISLR